MSQHKRTTKYVDKLFRRKDYYTLEHVLHPLDQFVDDLYGGCTLLLLTMIEDNTRVFRHIISTYGTQIMDEKTCETGDEDGWEALRRLMYEGRSGVRPKMALYEILLDEDAATEAKIKRHGDDLTNLYLKKPWRISKKCKRRSIQATVWCCKAICSFGADGLEEALGKRLQAASTWDWEPKMKRCKY